MCLFIISDVNLICVSNLYFHNSQDVIICCCFGRSFVRWIYLWSIVYSDNDRIHRYDRSLGVKSKNVLVNSGSGFWWIIRIYHLCVDPVQVRPDRSCGSTKAHFQNSKVHFRTFLEFMSIERSYLQKIRNISRKIFYERTIWPLVVVRNQFCPGPCAVFPLGVLFIILRIFGFL